jgi:hypothetical protein
MLASAQVKAAESRKTMRPRAASIAVALLLTGTACANGATRPTTSAPSAGPIVRAAELQNNKTITLREGRRLELILHSTYWQIQAGSNRAVLRRLGKPHVRPTRDCVAGGGCGTVTALYLAAAPGTAEIAATRNSCGEALGCTGTSGRYTLHVRVTPA